jgi:hypothetical protein
MLNTNRDPLEGVILRNSGTHVSIGWLLPPKTFELECAETHQQKPFDGWALAAKLPEPIVTIFESPLVPNSGSVCLVASSLGIHYPVVAIQSGSTQLRILLCLGNDQTKRWFEDVTAKGVATVALEVAGREQFAVTDLPCTLSAAARLEALRSVTHGLSKQDLVNDASRVATAMADRDYLPSLVDGFDTEHVRLVLALDTLTEDPSTAMPNGSRVLN